jgi:hypothetical protein
MDKTDNKPGVIEKNNTANAAVVVVVIGFIITTVLAVGVSFNEKTLMSFCREDALFEWSQAILLFMASIMFLIHFISKSGEKRDLVSYLSLFMAALCFFAFLEEISYGQRIFHLKTPYYFDRFNSHKEINVHNLPMFDNASEIVSFLFFVLWGIALPIILQIKKSWREYSDNRGLFVPPFLFALFNIIGLVIELILRFTYKSYWADSNVILESYLCLTIFGTGFYYMGLRLQSGEEKPAD